MKTRAAVAWPAGKPLTIADMEMDGRNAAGVFSAVPGLEKRGQSLCPTLAF